MFKKIDTYADDDRVFRNIADRLPEIKDRYCSVVDVEQRDIAAFESDFYGLLKEKMVDPSLYAITLFVNGYSMPTDWKGTTSILVPSEGILREIKNTVR